jgi:glycerol uptake facilitator-like aquaporin
MAYAIGPISGCHINPAVTAGLIVSRRLTLPEAVNYWIGQVLGAIVAAFALFIVIKAREGGYDLSDEGFGANGYGSHSPGGYPLGAALIIEILMTGLLVFTVLSATDRIANVAFAGIPIGLVLVLICLVGIPVDNLSVNPARSIGPAVFVGGWALGSSGCSSSHRSSAPSAARCCTASCSPAQRRSSRRPRRWPPTPPPDRVPIGPIAAGEPGPCRQWTCAAQ